MTVFLTVLLKIKLQESSKNAGLSLIFDPLRADQLSYSRKAVTRTAPTPMGTPGFTCIAGELCPPPHQEIGAGGATPSLIDQPANEGRMEG